MPDSIRTTCPYCGVGCGVLARPDGTGWAIAGDPDHPANRGRLCSKGTTLADTLGLGTRLLDPVVDGQSVPWDRAIAETARRIGDTIRDHGPDSFAFYLSGQLLTEDYYVANKLAKGFLGTANVDTNSRLCMASTVAGHRRAFGSDTVPGCYDDLELADLVVLVGSNLAWCHPVLFQRLKRAREQHGTRIVVIDPRRTDSCDIADLHLAIAPGDDVPLFNGLLLHLHRQNKLDLAFANAHTLGLDDTLAAARDGKWQPDPASLRFYEMFASTEKVVTVFSQGVNQSASGTDKVNAILNVHLATGRIGKPGCGPFSVTGQPNAMGGREVGGLANQLAVHMGFDPVSIDRAGRFWQAPRMAQREGLKAVDLFRAVDEGRVKAIWIMATNPAVSMPDADLVRRALEKCPTVIVSDCVADTDTQRFAHIRLPALAWGEKDGTVTNSDRTISRQRSFLPAPGQARADWRIMAQVAAAMGHGPAFAWDKTADVFTEYARMTAFENNGSRDLDLSFWIGADYDNLAPAQWGGRRLFANGRFFHPDGKARMVPVRHTPLRDQTNREFPLRLNTGRYRDQWHTMTRTGLSARLSGHRPQPFLDINPDDARALSMADGALARVESRQGDYIARLRITPDQPPGQVFLPLHWTDQQAARAIIGRLIPSHADPVSGQPESKHAAVRITPVTTSWSGVLITAAPHAPHPSSPWWVRHMASDNAQMVELAGDQSTPPDTLVTWADGQDFGQKLELIDTARGEIRCAWIKDGRLTACLFLAPGRPEISRSWITQLIGKPVDTPAGRVAVLAGQAAKGEDQGRLVCACFSVGLATLERAIREQHLTNVAEIGAALKAGTGCGSCVPELKELLAHARTGTAAE